MVEAWQVCAYLRILSARTNAIDDLNRASLAQFHRQFEYLKNLILIELSLPRQLCQLAHVCNE